MNKRMLASFAFALLTGGASTSFAAGLCSPCKITSLGSGAYYDNLCPAGSCVFISLSPTPTGRPACSYNTGWHFVLDTSTAAGKVTYSILLTAYASGQNVHVGGTNTCTVSPSGIVENLFYVSFAQ